MKNPTSSTPRFLTQLRPMLLYNRRCLPFDAPDWLFEVKNDGYRVLAESALARSPCGPEAGMTAPPGFQRLRGRLADAAAAHTLLTARCA